MPKDAMSMIGRNTETMSSEKKNTNPVMSASTNAPGMIQLKQMTTNE